MRTSKAHNIAMRSMLEREARLRLEKRKAAEQHEAQLKEWYEGYLRYEDGVPKMSFEAWVAQREKYSN